MAKNKFYVVWAGRTPGIYSSWEECKHEVEGYEGAKYKGFPTLDLARTAWNDDPSKYLSKELNVPRNIVCMDPDIGEPVPDSICVDAACRGNPGILEYRGVDTRSGAELFRKGPFPEGTQNIGEFLAIVHALAYLRERNSDWPVYSDSRIAIGWVKFKKIKTKLPRSKKNEQLFRLVDRALTWLTKNDYPNPVLKWQTAHWGEILADFGRK